MAIRVKDRSPFEPQHAAGLTIVREDVRKEYRIFMVNPPIAGAPSEGGANGWGQRWAGMDAVAVTGLDVTRCSGFKELFQGRST